MERIEDPIVEEVRKLREEHAAHVDNDVDAILDDLRRFEKESGWTVVSPEPKRIAGVGRNAPGR